jgi:RHS repeat-associated protein
MFTSDTEQGPLTRAFVFFQVFPVDADENRPSWESTLWVQTDLVSASSPAAKFQHTDALGSPVVVTEQAGTVIERNDYEPYGAIIGKPNYQGIGYTGHVQDAATGLTYMQQRYYDPMVGRFLSVDPVTALSSPVGMFNRYKYAANNPYRFVDPDGRQEKEEQERQRADFRSMSSHPGLGGAAISGLPDTGGSQAGVSGGSASGGATGSWAGGASGSWEAWEDRELASGRVESVCVECWVLPLLRAFRGGRCRRGFCWSDPCASRATTIAGCLGCKCLSAWWPYAGNSAHYVSSWTSIWICECQPIRCRYAHGAHLEVRGFGFEIWKRDAYWADRILRGLQHGSSYRN